MLCEGPLDIYRLDTKAPTSLALPYHIACFGWISATLKDEKDKAIKRQLSGLKTRTDRLPESWFYEITYILTNAQVPPLPCLIGLGVGGEALPLPFVRGIASTTPREKV